MVVQTVREKILAAVDQRREAIIGFTQDILRINSETGREGEVQVFLAEYLRRIGLEVDVFEPDLAQLRTHPAFVDIGNLDYSGRPNVVGLLTGESDARSLLLNGHVDTITPEPIDEWTDGPFSGVLRDGRIYGRGASDMKSGVAAIVLAVQTLIEAGLRPRGTVLLELVVDEEVTGYGTLACIQKGYRADAGICCETSDLMVMPACIGRLWFTVDLRGKSSGIATRWLAVSAIEKGIKICQTVEDLEKMRQADLHHPLYPDNRSALPCAVCMFNSGTFPSATPELATLRGSLGLMPYEDPEEVKAQFRAQIERVCQADPWLRNNPPRITFREIPSDGAEIPGDHPIVQTVARAFEAATGRPATTAGRTGGSDIRYLIKYGDTPTVIFGPGMSGEMHSTDEMVPVDYLVAAVKTLALAIHEWCN